MSSCCSSSVGKPSSKPHRWPHSTEAEIDERPQRVISIGDEQQFSFCNNSIKTSKYEFYNFLGIFLMEQFNPYTKLANCYFLIISGMQTIRIISNTNGLPTTLIPLSFVIIVAAIFGIAEDVARHKADRLANSSKTLVFDTSTCSFVEKIWADVVVGDFVKVLSREVVPADLVVLQVSERNPDKPKGDAYVETKSLDGETNLKLRNVIPAILGKIRTPEDLKNFQGRIEMEHPNNLIDSFTGVIESDLFLSVSRSGSSGSSGLQQEESAGIELTTAGISRSGSSLSQASSRKAPIAPNNVVLRGCVLRSTEWMVGIVVNTGHDVKVMQSNLEHRIKHSNLDSQATTQIIGLIVLLLWCCLTGATAQTIFSHLEDLDAHWYLDLGGNGGITEWVIQFFYELLLHASMIPVALYVSMEIIRFTQARFMNADLEMYYPPLDAPAVVRTMTLNEELGQVSHIFSDKTGTLTCNNMNFRKASINGVIYGQGITEIGRAAWKLLGKTVPADVEAAEKESSRLLIPHVSFYDPAFNIDMEREADTDTFGNKSFVIKSSDDLANPPTPRPGMKRRIEEFCRFLALCHEVVPERMEDGTVKLSAPNPDDEALVAAAGYFGYQFQDRDETIAIIHEVPTNKTLRVEVLYTIPFTSPRKRMSVIIRDIDGMIKIVCKGADSMMYTRLTPSMNSTTGTGTGTGIRAKTEKDIDTFSLEGLRCLVIAATILDESMFQQWRERYDAANTDLTQLDLRKKGQPNEIEALEDEIEQNLHIIGATGIEDRLQDGVPQCIEKLVQADIRVWVLTGDKEETAINIAVACNLVLPTDYMKQVIINKNTAPDLDATKEIFSDELLKYADMQSGGKEAEEWKPRALIIDGPSLIFVMADAQTRALLLKFSTTCQAVVCCRVSPDQKREIVDLVKMNVPGVRTLAVGDGANDVAMIKAAHIGVGIRGEEGVQAVNASDFAIAQFRFLKPLLLKHGRYNYQRMSNMILYMFYKNVLNSLTMFWFNFFCAFSGEKMYTEVAIQFFNLFYTSVPILLYATYDKDVAVSDAYRFPQLYSPGIHNQHFNGIVFWRWIGEAFIESLLCCILPIYFMGNYDYRTGVLSSYIETGAVTFTSIIIIINLKMIRLQTEWYSVSILIVLLSIGAWIACAYGVTDSDEYRLLDYDFYNIWERLLQSGMYWLNVLLLVVLISMKDVAIGALHRFVYFDSRLLLQEMRAFQLGHHSPDAIPDAEYEAEQAEVGAASSKSPGSVETPPGQLRKEGSDVGSMGSIGSLVRDDSYVQVFSSPASSSGQNTPTTKVSTTAAGAQQSIPIQSSATSTGGAGGLEGGGGRTQQKLPPQRNYQPLAAGSTSSNNNQSNNLFTAEL